MPRGPGEGKVWRGLNGHEGESWIQPRRTKSEAVRLDKALFRLHSEFRQKAKVRAQVIAPGHALISVVEEGPGELLEEDPVVTAFLAFLENDMKTHPRRMSGLSKQVIARAVRLTKGVKVTDDERLPEDTSF